MKNKEIEMIEYIEKKPTADEFNNLTDSVGWGRRDNLIIEEALKIGDERDGV